MKYLYIVTLITSFNTVAVDYQYDKTNRISQATYKDGIVVSYEYDADGNLTKVSPTESSSGGGTDNGGTDTGGTDNGTPETPEPAKQESGGGAFGWLTLLLTASFFALRSRGKVKLKS